MVRSGHSITTMAFLPPAYASTLSHHCLGASPITSRFGFAQSSPSRVLDGSSSCCSTKHHEVDRQFQQCHKGCMTKYRGLRVGGSERTGPWVSGRAGPPAVKSCGGERFVGSFAQSFTHLPLWDSSHGLRATSKFEKCFEKFFFKKKRFFHIFFLKKKFQNFEKLSPKKPITKKKPQPHTPATHKNQTRTRRHHTTRHHTHANH